MALIVHSSYAPLHLALASAFRVEVRSCYAGFGAPERAISKRTTWSGDTLRLQGRLSLSESSHLSHAHPVHVEHADQPCAAHGEQDTLPECRVSIGSTLEPRELFDAVAARLGIDAPTLVTLPNSPVRVPAVVLAVALEYGRVRALGPELVWLLAAATRYPTQDTLARVFGKSPRTVHSQVSAAVGDNTNFRDVVADLVWRAFVPGDAPRDEAVSGIHPRARTQRPRSRRQG